MGISGPYNLKMEALYHIRSYVVGIFPYIALTYAFYMVYSPYMPLHMHFIWYVPPIKVPEIVPFINYL